MLFIYNETELKGTLNFSEDDAETMTVNLGLTLGEDSTSFQLMTAKDPNIIDAIKKHFTNPTDVAYPMAKFFARVPKTPYMYDVETHVLEKHVNGNDAHHRNMIVLVLDAKSVYFMKKFDKVGAERHEVINVGDKSVKVVCLYTLFNNWNRLTRPVTILIKSAIDNSHNMQLELNYETTTHTTKNNQSIEIWSNRLTYERYEGEYPNIKKKKPVENKGTANNRKSGSLNIKTKPSNKTGKFKGNKNRK